MTRVVFCTGQSDRRRTALSPAHRAFASAIGAADCWPVNFPFAPDDRPHAPVPLVRASLANAACVVAAWTPGFAARHRAAVDEALGDGPALVLAGSCGLELLARARVPGLRDRAVILAYGSVAVTEPDAAIVRVVGRRDLLAAPFAKRTDLRVTCGHLDYLEQPAVRHLGRALLTALERGASPVDAALAERQGAWEHRR